MDTKLKWALDAYMIASANLHVFKNATYPTGTKIKLKGYGNSVVHGTTDNPITVLVKLEGGHIINAYITDIIQPKKAKVIK